MIDFLTSKQSFLTLAKRRTTDAGLAVCTALFLVSFLRGRHVVLEAIV